MARSSGVMGYRAPRLFAQITGLRRREVAGLTWYQVDFAAEVIRGAR
jgi:integrase